MLGVRAGFIQHLKSSWDWILSLWGQGDCIKTALSCFASVGPSVPVSARSGGSICSTYWPCKASHRCQQSNWLPACLLQSSQSNLLLHGRIPVYRWLIGASKISLWLSDPSRSAGLGQQGLQMQQGFKANLIWNCQGKNAHGGSCKTYPQSWAAFEHQLVVKLLSSPAMVLAICGSLLIPLKPGVCFLYLTVPSEFSSESGWIAVCCCFSGIGNLLFAPG